MHHSNHRIRSHIHWFQAGFVCCGLFALPSQGQEQVEIDGATWLPLTLNQSLQAPLDTVTLHVSTRKGCNEVLRAKVSESSAKTNPKFIITCSGDNNSTLNFVYWQSDIDENFNGDSYPKKQERQVYSEAERIRLRLEKLRVDNADLIENCRQKLMSKVDGRSLVLKAENISITQRGEQTPIVYMDYQLGESEYAPAYTATCRKGIDLSAQLSTFPRARH